MTYHFLAECLSTPWALEPSRMATYASFLAARYFGNGKMAAAAQRAPEAPAAAAPSRAGNRSGAIAVIPVQGVISELSAEVNICDGGTSAEAVSQALRQANADETVSAILLRMKTPGGSVFGVSEVAAEIRSSSKPVYGLAQSLSASAGYWWLSQCAECFVAPGGQAGSIGVYSGHENMEKALEMAGISIELISAGKYKTEGHPFGPLSAEARAHMQSQVDDYYGMFTRDVAKGRKVSVDQVRNGMGEGRVLNAQQAKDAGLVDGVMTFDQVVRHINARIAPAKGRTAQEQQRQQLALLALE